MKQMIGSVIRVLGLACVVAAAVWPRMVMAHPDHYVDQRPNGVPPPVPGGSNSDAQRSSTQQTKGAPASEPSRNSGVPAANEVEQPATPPRPIRPGVSFNNPSVAVTGRFPTGNRYPFIGAIQKGYKSNVLTCVGQASHEHVLSEDDLKTNPMERINPVELWYVSTRKTTKETPGTPFYCVAPRVESATSLQWPRAFEVRLMEYNSDEKRWNVRKKLNAPDIPAGGSLEVFSVCVAQVNPPVWRVETDHGEAQVVFPAKNMARPSCGPIANAQAE